MSGIEAILPRDHQFNETVRVFREELVEQFVDEAERTGDVLDVAIEFGRSPQEVWELSGVLSAMLKSEDERTEDVQGAVYRGINFGLQVVDVVSDGPLRSISLQHWNEANEMMSAKEFGAVIYADVQTYLAERPDVDAFIGFFMPEVSGEAYMLLEHHIETAIGLMMMICERNQAEAYLHARMESLSQDDIYPQAGYTEEDN